MLILSVAEMAEKLTHLLTLPFIESHFGKAEHKNKHLRTCLPLVLYRYSAKSFTLDIFYILLPKATLETE